MSCIDKDGNILIAAAAGRSATIPITAGAFQTAPPATGGATIFVMKLSPEHKILFSTYLSGSNYEAAKAIAVDRDGNVLIAGQTGSPDFPTTASAFQRIGAPDMGNTYDGFVTKLSADGTRLIYSTFLGGDRSDTIEAIAVDSLGRAYVAGSTTSANFPIRGTVSPASAGSAFLARLSSDGTALDYSIRFGGSGTSEARAIALASNGFAYLGGFTDSPDFPGVQAVQPKLANVTIYRSDGGGSWVAMPELGVVSSMAVDPTTANNLYLGTMATVMKSKDGGKTWLPKPLPGSSSATVAIDVNPANPNLLLAVSGGIYSSKDAGDTWFRVSDQTPLHAVQVSADGQVVLADNPLRRSVDGGKTFGPVAVPPEIVGGAQRILTRDRSANDAVFVIQSGVGTYRVSAGGTKVDFLYPSAALLTMELAQDPNNPSTMYSLAGAVVYRSVDAGKTWEFYAISGDGGGTVLDVASNGTIITGSSAGARRSTDLGKTWQKFLTGLSNRDVQRIVNVPGTDSWFAISSKGYDGFVTAISPDQDALSFSTTLGGAADDVIRAIALTSGGQVFVAGRTSSTDLPVSASAQQKTIGGPFNAFAAVLDPLIGTVKALTYVGGESVMDPYGAALKSNDEPVIVGRTGSTGFPQTDSLFTGPALNTTAPGFILLDSGLTSIRMAAQLGVGGEARSASFDPQGRLVIGGIGGIIKDVLSPLERTFIANPNGSSALISTIDFGGIVPQLLLDPVYAQFDALGGRFTLNVTTSAAWSASTTVPWIFFGSAPSGTGSAPISITVAPSFSMFRRTGSISIGGKSVLVAQSGVPGLITAVSPYPVDMIPAAGSRVTFQLTASAIDYAWTAVSDSSWAAIQGNASGSGSGQITVQFAPNPQGTERTGIIFVGNWLIHFTQAAQTGVQPGLRYVSLQAPCRAADTRSAFGLIGPAPMTGNSSHDFTITPGPCGVPANAVAYALNVTVVPVEPLAYLTIWPAGQPRPNASTLNSDGRIKANSAIIPAGANGAVSVYVTNTTDVVLDVQGYFVAESGLMFYPVTPCRLSDTRLGYGGTLAAGEDRTFPVTSGVCGIPTTAQAVSMNITAVPKAPLGFLTVWPAGQARPFASTLNSVNGGVVANAALVALGTNGAIHAYATGATDLVLDVNGYFAPPAAGGLSFYAMTPCRTADTRMVGGIMQAQEARTFGYGSQCQGLVTTARAWSLNATVVPSKVLSYLTLGPPALPFSFVSTLNSPDGSIVANAAIVPSSGASIKAFVTDATHLILDVNGYFAP